MNSGSQCNITITHNAAYAVMLLKSTCISNHYMAWLHWHTKHLPFCAAFLPLSTFAFRVKQYQNSCTDSLFPFADFCPTCRVSFVPWESLKWSTIKYIFISMFISLFSSSFFCSWNSLYWSAIRNETWTKLLPTTKSWYQSAVTTCGLLWVLRSQSFTLNSEAEWRRR